MKANFLINTEGLSKEQIVRLLAKLGEMAKEIAAADTGEKKVRFIVGASIPELTAAQTGEVMQLAGLPFLETQRAPRGSLDLPPAVPPIKEPGA